MLKFVLTSTPGQDLLHIAPHNGATRDSLTAQICDWLRIGESIHTTFTDLGYLDVAIAVHLLLT